jgi:hypothetical protein
VDTDVILSMRGTWCGQKYSLAFRRVFIIKYNERITM